MRPDVRRRARRRFPLAAALAPGLPAVAAAWWLAWQQDRAAGPAWATAAAAAATLAWLAGAAALRAHTERPLQTLANLLAALRGGDFSLRARAADARPHPDDALALALHEANLLADTLRGERLGALENAALLRRVLAEVDVALFAFDEGGRLRLVNRAGERLLARPAPRALGEDAHTLGLAGLVEAGADDGTPRVVAATFPGGAGRWEVRTGAFRQGGRPHQLLVVTDLSEALRAEERQAWQRLVRVLSHEINNSLAPIKTIAGSLRRRVARAAVPADGLPADGLPADGLPAGGLPPDAPAAAADVLARGLGTIAERADALARFVGAYARLTRLPPPARRRVDVGAWVRRVAALEVRTPVRVAAGPPVRLDADPDQLDQLLINLVRNAADAALETGGGVTVAWEVTPAAGGAQAVRVLVDDDGPGLAATANLFVPFYSTKPEGSGIGLALARQIAEAHGGTVTLANRDGVAGCRATTTLPAS